MHILSEVVVFSSRSVLRKQQLWFLHPLPVASGWSISCRHWHHMLPSVRCASGMNSSILVSINIKLNSHSWLVSGYCISTDLIDSASWFPSDLYDFSRPSNTFSYLKDSLCLEKVFLYDRLFLYSDVAWKYPFSKSKKFPEYLDYWGRTVVICSNVKIILHICFLMLSRLGPGP